MTIAEDWSPLPPADLSLSADEVHVWRVSLDLPQSSLQRLWRTLAADERERAERFVLEKHRRRFIAARGQLRNILSRYLQIEPGLLRFSYSRQGKPRLAAGPDRDALSFNLTHSCGTALYAITRGRAIGIDLERIRTDYPFEQVAERFFAGQESATLRELPEQQKPEAFFTCWTRKEAYMKARGDGLSHPLRQFAVSLIPGEPAVLVSTGGDPQEHSRWSLHDLRPGDGYAAALAVEGGGWRLSKFSDRAANGTGAEASL